MDSKVLPFQKIKRSNLSKTEKIQYTNTSKKSFYEPEKVSVQKRCEMGQNEFFRYRNSRWRWRRIWERPMDESEEHVSLIYYAVGGFKYSIKELVKNGVLKKEDFLFDYNLLVKEGFSIPDQAYEALFQLPFQIRIQIVLDICRNMHNGYIYEYAEDFFCHFIDYEYVYLPFELIGVDRICYVFNPLVPFLMGFGLSDVSWEFFVEEYDRQRLEYVKNNNLKNVNDLTKHIIEIGKTNPNLRPDIKRAMQSKEMAFSIAQQVMRYSSELFNGTLEKNMIKYSKENKKKKRYLKRIK